MKNLGIESGRVLKYSSDILFRSILVRHIEQLSFRDLIIRLNDSMFFRDFIHLGYDSIMGFTLVETAEKMIQPQTWEKINLLLSNYAISKELISGEALRLDSTITESNIHFSTDSSLLWDCYRTISSMMIQCHEQYRLIPYQYRFHDNKIKQLHTFFSTHSLSKKKSAQRKVRKSLLLLLDRMNSATISAETFIASKEIMLETEATVIEELNRIGVLSKKIVDQIKKVHVDNITVPGNQKIYSLFEDHTELLMRGKSNKPTEFGHLVSIGQTGEKFK